MGEFCCPTHLDCLASQSNVAALIMKSAIPPALPLLPTGRYRHYKGGEYEVMGMAHHSETLEPMVIYKPLYNDTGWWVRPYTMFVEPVLVEGTSRPRFARIVD